MNKTEKQLRKDASERAEETLRRLLSIGQPVYIQQTHWTPQSKWYSLFCVGKELNREGFLPIIKLDHIIKQWDAEYNFNQTHGGLRAGDGFDIVYHLGDKLFNSPYALNGQSL